MDAKKYKCEIEKLWTYENLYVPKFPIKTHGHRNTATQLKYLQGWHSVEYSKDFVMNSDDSLIPGTLRIGYARIH